MLCIGCVESQAALQQQYLYACSVINLHTSRCVRIIGKEESVRYLHLALHQGQIGKTATHSIVCVTM